MITGKALAEALRNLADLVDSGVPMTIDIEPEQVGRAAKTTITIWALETPGTPPAPVSLWCKAPRGDMPGRRCNTLLRAHDGSCPQASRHA